MKAFQRILVATDCSAASTPALNKAVDMAKENGAELFIIYVYQPPNITQADGVALGLYDEWDRNLRAAAEEKLRPIVDEAKKAGANARALVRSGVPYEEIADAAKEKETDLVIMGTHGRKGVSRFFLGSVASRVISTAPCPVMTIRAA